MATKTFEELKQLAIQIRDEKTNKQNTATRIGTQMLEHLDKLEQDYYDKTATDEKFTELEKKEELANVNFPLRDLYNYNDDPFLSKSKGGWDISALQPTTVINSIFNYDGNCFKTAESGSYGIVSIFKKTLPELAPENGYTTFEICSPVSTTLYFQISEDKSDRVSVNVLENEIICVQIPYTNRAARIIPFSTGNSPSYYIGRIFCGNKPMSLSGLNFEYEKSIKPNLDKDLSAFKSGIEVNLSELRIQLVKQKLGVL